MKILSGKDVAGYIAQRHQKQFRQAKSKLGRPVRLSIVQVLDDPVIDSYVRVKQSYGQEMGVDVQLHKIDQSRALELISQLNSDDSVDGIIVQLPLEDESERARILNAVLKTKDVDGLAEGTDFDPATPQAVLWLIDGYNINLKGKSVLIIGQGQLVGAPLARMLQEGGIEVNTADESTVDLAAAVRANDIIISAAGVPGLLQPEMVNSQQIIIDTGVASDKGVNKGDVDPRIIDDEMVSAITPARGGVGPLTVCALFENLLKAALGTYS